MLWPMIFSFQVLAIQFQLMLITHPNHLHNMNDSSFFKDKAILAHMNATVDAVNDYVLNLILGK